MPSFLPAIDPETLRQGQAGLTEIVVGSSRRIADTVDGTVVVMAAIVAAAGDQRGWDLATTVAGVSLAIWIAHIYTQELGEIAERKRPPTWGRVRAVAAAQAPVLYAAALPTAVLVLAAVGLVEQSVAVWAALGVGLLVLGVEGSRLARRQKMGVLGSTLVVSLNLVLGAAIILFKVLVTE